MKIPGGSLMSGFRTSNGLSKYTHVTNGWRVREYQDPYVRSYQNKPDPINGNYVNPTPYFRKICLLTQNYFDLTRVPYRLYGDSGYLFGLASIPHGSNYADPEVVVPDWMISNTTQAAMLEMEGMSANFMEDFAQAKQTVAQLAVIYENICHLLSLIALRRWKQIGKLLRPTVSGAANDYLAWKYGILPLVGTFNALTKDYSPRYGTFRVRKRAELAVDPLGFINNTSAPYCVVVSGKASQQVQVGLTCRVKMSADLVRQAATRWDTLDARELLATGWALLPYSFVLDWLIPVESWLLTRSWSSYIEFQSGYVTKRLICDAEFIRAYAIPRLSGMAPITGSWPRATVKSLQMKRMAYNSYTPPHGLTVKWPLSPSQLTSAAALLVQRGKL